MKYIKSIKSRSHVGLKSKLDETSLYQTKTLSMTDALVILRSSKLVHQC